MNLLSGCKVRLKRHSVLTGTYSFTVPRVINPLSEGQSKCKIHPVLIGIANVSELKNRVVQNEISGINKHN